MSAPVQALLESSSSADAHLAAEKLAEYVNEQGLRVTAREHILDTLVERLRSKKSASDRERAAIGLGALATKVGGKNAPMPNGAEPWLGVALVPLLENYADKNDAAKKAAESAVSALAALYRNTTCRSVQR